jgi:hypothetical protein
VIHELQFHGVPLTDFQIGMAVGALVAVGAAWVVLVLALGLLRAGIRS